MTKKKATKVRTPKLASLPSAAILQAVGDLIKAEKDAKLLVVMNEWVTPFRPGAEYTDEAKRQGKPKANCAVCFAGAVMMNVPQPKEVVLTTTSFEGPVQSRLDALDEFRQGNVQAGLRAWGYDSCFASEHAPLAWDVANYDRQPTRFKTQMRTMAKALAAVGF